MEIVMERMPRVPLRVCLLCHFGLGMTFMNFLHCASFLFANNG